MIKESLSQRIKDSGYEYKYETSINRDGKRYHVYNFTQTLSLKSLADIIGDFKFTDIRYNALTFKLSILER